MTSGAEAHRLAMLNVAPEAATHKPSSRETVLMERPPHKTQITSH
jgi:hypothetical protein